jgi:non-lysosomal glucosylceramidase
MTAAPIFSIPASAWSRPLGLGWDTPYIVRYASNLDDGPFHGMPLGGFGAGCLGRSHRGDFNLWHIDGGEHLFRPLPACQFSLFEQRQGEDIPTQAYALCTEAPEHLEAASAALQAWNWYPARTTQGATGTYHALYPRSWFVYEGVFAAQVTCEQFSPIWAHNYQESSYPVALFLWTAHNPTKAPLTLSLMVSWQNVVGWFTNTNAVPEIVVRDDGSPVYDYQPNWGQSQGNLNQWLEDGDTVGLLMDNALRPDRPREGDGQWAIATLAHSQIEISFHSRWNPEGDGAEVWDSFATEGRLPNQIDPRPAAANEQIAGAIALRFTLLPGETRQIPVAVVWDSPVMEFAAGVEYHRRYTDFFGRTGRHAWAIAKTALHSYADWQTQIQAWQQPILTDPELPNWLKMALFNELYVLTDGATVWSAATEADPVGQFAVAECLDYRWYESLDVRLYGSFALLHLFPELEKAVMRAFARAIPTADTRVRTIGYYQVIGAESPSALRKVKNATPHDLGAPNEHPWVQTNYTSYQDCNLWKDLPCDFVLQVYRDFVLTGATDVAFLQDCWPSVVAALDYLKTFDEDGDGIPENSGAPDQTFDDWRLQGVSAYCGGLWIAALEAAIAMAHHLQSLGVKLHPASTVPLDHWKTWLQQARSHYHSSLWTGQYYRLDTDSSSDVVMADQLCGQFYAALLGLPNVVPLDCAQVALETIYDTCFLKFQGGKLGAANGLRPDGSPLNPQDTHPLEVWTGINFGLAAFLVQMGHRDKGLHLAEAVVTQIYTHGLQFRTPEAITANGTFRASHYLRPLAIWLLYLQLSKTHFS